jgi:23S rRNA pseudouridine1911/1915/1917 synthase
VRDGTLVQALLHHCGPSLREVGGASRPGIVHRLDKGTTGVLLVAKTPSAYQSLVAQFAARTVGKTYLAVVHGVPEATGRVDAPIARSSAVRTRMAVVASGRPAASEWTRLEAFGRSAALIEVEFVDGERILGLTVRYPPIKPFFFVLPADDSSNNVRILVNRAAVRTMSQPAAT